MRRTFNADEIAKILRSQNGDEFDLADGLRAVRMANKSGLVWTIEVGDIRNGADIFLKDADPAMLNKISEILWTKVAPQFLSSQEILDPELTPENLIEKPEDNDMTPLELREKPDDPTLEPDPTGLIPDYLRKKKGPAEPTLEDELTPDRLRSEGK
jgi:hypothetical protein